MGVVVGRRVFFEGCAGLGWIQILKNCKKNLVNFLTGDSALLALRSYTI